MIEDSAPVKVRLLVDFRHLGKTIGDIVEVEGYTAALWIRSGSAKAYTPPVKPKKESADA
jgi:hypothetical protein